jgi:hypothetical protein
VSGGGCSGGWQWVVEWGSTGPGLMGWLMELAVDGDIDGDLMIDGLAGRVKQQGKDRVRENVWDNPGQDQDREVRGEYGVYKGR